MAGIGLCLLIIQLAQKRNSQIHNDFFRLSLWAGIVSLIAYFAAVVNNTPDFTYATYVVSMWVWTAAAYLVVQIINRVHGGATVELVINYLTTVCVVQCLIALALDMSPLLRYWISSFYDIDTEQKRLSGIGAGLDVAGSRFAAVLIMIAYQMVKKSTSAQKMQIGIYTLAFVIISVIGNMISRTTSVGLLFSLCYFIYKSEIYKFQLLPDMKYIFMWLLGILLVFVPIVIYEYNANPSFQEHFKFGFEGFFSLVETGKWEVHSNNILKNMYVFPENIKTWLIGDGYLNNPVYSDPYYTGITWMGYYRDTDVGYLRFIFYFGLLGLIPFCIFMCRVCKVCMNLHPSYQKLFVLILLLNFAVWFKVSTDIFLVLAIFLVVSSENNRESSIKNADYENCLLHL